MAIMRRPRGRIALTIVFAALSLNAWAQVLLVPLGPLLDLPADARPGPWTGAAAVLAGAGAGAWYLRRAPRTAVPVGTRRAD